MLMTVLRRWPRCYFYFVWLCSFPVLFSIVITSFGRREGWSICFLCICLLFCARDIAVLFLLILGSGVGFGLYLWRSLEISNSFLCILWAAPNEFGTYRLCEQRRFRRACASGQSRQNLCCSLIQAVNQEEPSDRKPDPCPLWMARHAQLKFVMRNARRHKFAWRGF